jgi:hypothetical protein
MTLSIVDGCAQSNEKTYASIISIFIDGFRQVDGGDEGSDDGGDDGVCVSLACPLSCSS